MARSIEWPPVVRNGRVTEVEGVEATGQIVVQTLGNHGAHPYIDPRLYTGDLTFRSDGRIRSRITSALRRLKALLIDVRVATRRIDDAGGFAVDVDFIDAETGERARVSSDG
jgi:hypothetical protein